jgi:tetratricopeptide (TPR) repeat protein
MFGFFRNLKKAIVTPTVSSETASESATAPRLISFVDAYGRSFQMPLEQWQQDVLAPNLKAKWNEPAELYSLIISALRDDSAPDVDVASARLMDIDPVLERGFSTRAIVQLKLGRTREAGETLRQAIAKVGETGILLTNQAKVIRAEGNQALAMSTLDRSLDLDPNQDNGLAWRVAELTESSRTEAAHAYLRALAEHHDAWRPQLLLGQRAIQAGQREEGLVWFDHALRQVPHGADVMLVISGELGKQGLLNDLVQRVAPLYDERRDDIRVGYNLLQAYVDLGDASTGLALLERLFALGQPAFAQHLQHYAKTFDDMTKQAPKVLNRVPDISMVQMALPPWLLSMHDMEWAAPTRNQDRPRVMLLPLAAVDESPESVVRSGREDARGRLSRALPLFLLEQLTYCSDVNVALNLPVVDGHGLVLFGGPVEDEQLAHWAQDADLAVEGEVSHLDEGFKIICRLRRLSDLSTLKRVERHVNEQDAGDGLIALSGEILTAIGAAVSTTIEPRVPMYTLPTTHANEYLSALGQCLALTLASSAHTRDSLYGERNIYGWLQSLAVSLPGNEPAQFMYFTALAKGRRLNSPIVGEFERPAAQHMRDLVRAGRYSARLLPLMAAVYPDNAELGDLLASAKPTGDDAYATWCGRLASAFPVMPTPPSRA